MKIPTKSLIDRCCKIADLTADRSGFVAIRDLASGCNCQVIPRPLLVEAAITTSINSPGSWAILINDEIHQFSDEDFEYESSLSPLHPRTRNTIAHEVAHAVAIDLLGIDFAGKGILSDRLSIIERAVEKSSPLLLLPKSSVISRLRQIRSAEESLQRFSQLHKLYGVSREVFLEAINTFSKYHRREILLCDSLLGALWGIIEFSGKKTFTTFSRHTFDNHFKTKSHPAGRLIQERNSAKWEIESIEETEGRIFCIATLESHASNWRKIRFEIESFPKSGRHKMFFRLAGINFGHLAQSLASSSWDSQE